VNLLVDTTKIESHGITGCNNSLYNRCPPNYWDLCRPTDDN